ncbi:OmpA-OmpF porin, OOP family [Octadecabacter temperatus]|uniref:Outer membrane porin F n=1 Tax=Octadecabacter temperatus TaxID=1458307 RepID=A0A0K0Y1B0_9RHOB|nr:OmpA family protein [Octadecabacter temperatus]AKS44702.1 Outer membrane porin F precursor [Octadecabacter temperatus]SIO36276.1 OmpA-OmpF porin, OOP family [Octadecabacter temperatus]
MTRFFALLIAATVSADQAAAVTLDMPSNATLEREDLAGLDSYAMPTGPWTPEGLPILTGTGEVRKQAWRIEAPGLTTLQLLQPLMDQLSEAGFEELFTCTDDACGGFDFRFATPVLPAPAMHVDLGDYRFVATQRVVDGNTELLSILASRSSSAGFVQVIRVGAAVSGPVASADAPAARAISTPTITGDLAQTLEAVGYFVLSDLAFQTGSAQLGDATFATLDDLAEYLVANPERTVALVGHTDSVGSLDGNIALSKRRAGSVLERLVTSYDIPRRQLEAEGMGYLSPVATNLTEEGREANRRVEVIVTSTE